MTRDLNALIPKVKQLAELVIANAKEQGIDMIITGTYRTFREQDELYAQGRTKPGKIVTYAKGGESFHNVRLAFDFAILIGKKVSYTCTSKYYQVGEIGKRLGLFWGGDFAMKDLCHFEYRYCEKCKREHSKATSFREDGSCKNISKRDR